MENTDAKNAPASGDVAEAEHEEKAGAEENDSDERKADSAFDDLEIEVDESELESELDGQSSERKS